jgi:hypothetical protein
VTTSSFWGSSLIREIKLLLSLKEKIKIKRPKITIIKSRENCNNPMGKFEYSRTL